MKNRSAYSADNKNNVTAQKRGVDVPEGILTVDSAVDYLLPFIKKEAR